MLTGTQYQCEERLWLYMQQLKFHSRIFSRSENTRNLYCMCTGCEFNNSGTRTTFGSMVQNISDLCTPTYYISYDNRCSHFPNSLERNTSKFPLLPEHLNPVTGRLSYDGMQTALTKYRTERGGV